EAAPFPVMLRVRTDVGVGWAEDDGSVFLVSQLGRFRAHYMFELSNNSGVPFDDDEIVGLISLTPAGSSFDILPGTDIDEWISGGANGVEKAIADFVNDGVLPVMESKIGERLRDQLDEQLRPVRDALEDFPLAQDEVLNSKFLQINALTTSLNGIDITARGGLWSATLELLGQDLTCAVTTLALMHPRTQVYRAGRAHEKALRTHGLEKWAAVYRAHQKEIAAILRKNPALARSAVRLIRDSHPVHLMRGGTLTPPLAARFEALAEDIAKRAEPKLAARAHL